MKKWIKALLSGLVIVALTVSMLTYLTRLVELKDRFGYERFVPFYEQEENSDVIFLGTSHMFSCVYPTELWKDHGIVSYNMAGPNSVIPQTYWMMETVLDQVDPKLMVIDCYRLSETEKLALNDTGRKHSHYSLDFMPFSVNKLRALKDLVFDTPYCEEFLWSFSIYHERWQELTKNDFAPTTSPEKGSLPIIRVAEPATFDTIDRSKVLEEETTAVVYLRRMIERCQEEGIDVLLVYLPFPASEKYQIEANTMEEIASEYNVNAINFLRMDVVDYSTDCYDTANHLNPSGARKITDYLGQYITDHYDLPDRREDPDYAGWHDDYAEHIDYKLDMLAEQTKLDDYLMLLQDKNVSACVFLRESDLWAGKYHALLKNMGIESGGLYMESPTLVIADRILGKVFYLQPGQTAETGFGEVRFSDTDGIQLDGEDKLAVSEDAVIGIMAVDNTTGRTVKPVQFAESEDEKIRTK